MKNTPCQNAISLTLTLATLAAGGASLLESAAQARDFDSLGSYGSFRFRDEVSLDHMLSIGGGVAAPSETTSYGENPAGLIYNHGPKLVGSLATGGAGQQQLGNSALFFIGDGLSAGSLGVQTFNNVHDDVGAVTYFHFGLSTLSESLNTAFGLSGRYRFQKQGTAAPAKNEKTWTADLGLLINPNGLMRIGFTAYDIAERVSAYGVGVSTNVNRSSIVALDASANNAGRGITIKPSIGILASSLQMTYGYGYQIDRGFDTGISTGNTYGLGFVFSPTFQIQGYYNQFSLYSLAATLRF